MTTVKPSPSFRRMADMLKADLHVVPLIEGYMRASKFPKYFEVAFRDEGKERKPDDFFHPSTHPSMPERLLYYYLTLPEDRWIGEDIAYENRMAMIMGTAVHSFMQTCMIDAGILLKPTGTCVACQRPHGTRKNECDEFGALDPTLGRRGHMDGILNITEGGWGRGLFEFKTINPNAAFGLEHGAIDWLKKRHMDYYLQLMEYMEMTGLPKAIIVFCVLGFPWKLIEIEVPFDHAASQAVKRKYANVRMAQETGVLPDACCAPLSKEAKECPARQACPIARIQ